jgi:hypothetical protein
MKKACPASRKVFGYICVLLGVLAMCSVSFAQAGSSSVRGIVTDLQGRTVSGANVSLINDPKNFNRTQTTSDNGSYVFTAVPPGTYRVEVEASGFKKASISQVQALVDTPANSMCNSRSATFSYSGGIQDYLRVLIGRSRSNVGPLTGRFRPEW